MAAKTRIHQRKDLGVLSPSFSAASFSSEDEELLFQLKKKKTHHHTHLEELWPANHVSSEY